MNKVLKRIKEVLKRYFNQDGVTLVELMVVMAIIAILGVAIVPKLMDIPRKARVSQTKQNIQALSLPLSRYALDNGSYPTTEQGLQALISEPTVEPVPGNYNPGGYLDNGNLPKDAWGNEFIYISPGADGREYDIISLGADKAEGGEKYNADINSWEIE